MASTSHVVGSQRPNTGIPMAIDLQDLARRLFKFAETFRLVMVR